MEDFDAVIGYSATQTVLKNVEDVVSHAMLAGKTAELLNLFLNSRRLEIAARFLGPTGEVLIGGLALFIENTEERINKQFEKVFERFDKVLEEISQLDSKLTRLNQELKTEVKLTTFFEKYIAMSSSMNKFYTTVLTQSSDEAEFLRRVSNFIDEYERDNNEYLLVQAAITGIHGFDSLIRAIEKVALEFEKSNFNDKSTSSSKLLYEFQIPIIMKVNEGLEFLRFCYLLQGNGVISENKQRVLEAKRNTSVRLLMETLKSTMKRSSKQIYHNLAQRKSIRLIDVLQKLKDPKKSRADAYRLVNEEEFYKNFDKYARKVYLGKISAPDNFVITGVRIVKKQKVISMQIEVGSLLPLGMIDSNSVYWQELPDFHSLPASSFFQFPYMNRVFALGELVLKERLVLSAVQFTTTSLEKQEMVLKSFWGLLSKTIPIHENIEKLSFKIYGRSIDSFSLTQSGTEEQQILNDPTPFPNSIHIWGKKIGLNSCKRDFEIKKNTTLQFGVSEAIKDAGQPFVPYFDGSDITFDSRSPISGLGFLHYTNDQSYAGFIRPYIFSFNYENFFD